MTSIVRRVMVCMLGLALVTSCSSSDDGTRNNVANSGGPNNGSGTNNNGPGPVTPNNGMGPTSQLNNKNVCAEAKIEVNEAIPTVILLIDRSGSMNADFGDTSRWEAVYDALMSPAGGLVTAFESSISFGLALYTSDDGGPNCPELVQVQPKLQNRADIDTIYAPIPVPNSGDTPTGDALSAIIPMFAGLEAQGPRVILLATDGEPDTCAEPDPQNGQEDAVAAASAAFAQGIKTFILSVGDDVSQGHLEEMARAGSGLAANDPNPPAFRANDRTALIAALGSIIESNRSCIFDLEGSRIEPTLANTGSVTLDGADLSFETDWIFHQSAPPCFGGAQCIELRGEACTRFLEQDAQLEATFPCEAIIIL